MVREAKFRKTEVRHRRIFGKDKIKDMIIVVSCKGELMVEIK